MARVTRPAVAWWSRDHHSRSSAAVLVLPGLVRPHRAVARPALGRAGRVRLPAVERAALPGPRGAGVPPDLAGAGGRALDPHRGRDHRPPLGHASVVNTTQAQRWAPCWRRAVRAPRLLDETERRLAAVAGGYGDVLAGHAEGTLAAGEAAAPDPRLSLRRRRPRAAGGGRFRRGAPAHGHPGARRRARPGTAAARAPHRVRGRRRPAATATGDLLFSRAFAELARPGGEERGERLVRGLHRLARGELVQRADAWDPEVTPERYLERCRLKTSASSRHRAA